MKRFLAVMVLGILLALPAAAETWPFTQDETISSETTYTMSYNMRNATVKVYDGTVTIHFDDENDVVKCPDDDTGGAAVYTLEAGETLKVSCYFRKLVITPTGSVHVKVFAR